jgi:hypothetical protein
MIYNKLIKLAILLEKQSLFLEAEAIYKLAAGDAYLSMLLGSYPKSLFDRALGGEDFEAAARMKLMKKWISDPSKVDYTEKRLKETIEKNKDKFPKDFDHATYWGYDDLPGKKEKPPVDTEPPKSDEPKSDSSETSSQESETDSQNKNDGTKEQKDDGLSLEPFIRGVNAYLSKKSEIDKGIDGVLRKLKSDKSFFVPRVSNDFATKASKGFVSNYNRISRKLTISYYEGIWVKSIDIFGNNTIRQPKAGDGEPKASKDLILNSNNDLTKSLYEINRIFGVDTSEFKSLEDAYKSLPKIQIPRADGSINEGVILWISDEWPRYKIRVAFAVDDYSMGKTFDQSENPGDFFKFVSLNTGLMS